MTDEKVTVAVAVSVEKKKPEPPELIFGENSFMGGSPPPAPSPPQMERKAVVEPLIALFSSNGDFVLRVAQALADNADNKDFPKKFKGKTGARGKVGKNGRDAVSPSVEEIAHAIVDDSAMFTKVKQDVAFYLMNDPEYLKATNGIPGLPGKPGVSPSVDDVATKLLSNVTFRGLIKGADGKSPSAVEVANALLYADLDFLEMARGRAGRDGENGYDGKDGDSPSTFIYAFAGVAFGLSLVAAIVATVMFLATK